MKESLYIWAVGQFNIITHYDFERRYVCGIDNHNRYYVSIVLDVRESATKGKGGLVVR